MPPFYPIIVTVLMTHYGVPNQCFSSFPKLLYSSSVLYFAGTEMVLEACKANNVPNLIYCSSISVFVGYDEVKEGTEKTVPVPHKFLFDKYAVTKSKAQNMALRANGDILKNGSYDYLSKFIIYAI
jgi:nucleoside-diphosphate-sugar epimerase